MIRIAVGAILVAIADFAAAGEAPLAAQRHRSYLTLPHECRAAELPYTLQHAVGEKRLFVFGTKHDRNFHAPMYARLETALRNAQPEVIIHEAIVPADLPPEPLPQAVQRAADLGFTATLAAKIGAVLRSGDAPARWEIDGLLKSHAAEDVFVFLVAQRFVGSDRHPDVTVLQREYPSFVHDYLEANGFPLEDEWRTWEGFLKAFLHVSSHSFMAATWDPKWLNPTYRTGVLSDVVRSSEDFRDATLISAIRNELQHHNRVAVVFGCWHVMAIEPALAALSSQR